MDTENSRSSPVLCPSPSPTKNKLSGLFKRSLPQNLAFIDFFDVSIPELVYCLTYVDRYIILFFLYYFFYFFIFLFFIFYFLFFYFLIFIFFRKILKEIPLDDFLFRKWEKKWENDEDEPLELPSVYKVARRWVKKKIKKLKLK